MPLKKIKKKPSSCKQNHTAIRCSPAQLGGVDGSQLSTHVHVHNNTKSVSEKNRLRRERELTSNTYLSFSSMDVHFLSKHGVK